MGQRVTVGQVGDLADGESMVVPVHNKAVAIFLIDGQYFAIDDVCPHQGASLSTGWVEDGIVTCPWHYWRFRLSDGAWADNPRIKTGCYPVHIEGEAIQVEVPTPPSDAEAGS